MHGQGALHQTLTLSSCSAQILFISGVVCIIGVYNAFRFFFGSADKMKGTSFFLSGVMCVLLFSPMLGMLVELVGLYYLFR